jgi:murein DD-endopeptidase MepM/ murein hydrolase activator NlpD
MEPIGCTIIISNNNISVSYCHLSPIFLVNLGDKIDKGDIIGKVGPKNIYNIPNNPYKDSNGNPTNGATTGCHLHLTIKKDGIAVNPLNFFN